MVLMPLLSLLSIQATAIIRSSFREVLFLDSDNIPAASLMPLDTPIPAAVLADAQNATDPWTRVRDDGSVEEVWGKPTGLWEACVAVSPVCQPLTETEVLTSSRRSQQSVRAPRRDVLAGLRASPGPSARPSQLTFVLDCSGVRRPTTPSGR